MARMVDLIRASAVPSNLMQSAAKGSLSVPPREMIEILVYLAVHNKVFSEQARLTLAGWDEAASRAAASDPKTPKEVRLKAFWAVYNQSMKPVFKFEYNEKKHADKKAAELTANGKSPHFVQLLKEVIEE